MSEQPFLEVHLHLVNGNTHKFIQKDPVAADQILTQFNLKVFSLPSLVIFGDKKVATYQGSALVGVSILMKHVPDELLQINRNPDITIHEISQDIYHSRQKDLIPPVAGQPLVLLQEIEFITGLKIWIETHIPHAASGIQERHLLHNWFQEKSLLCHRLGGGITMWSRAHIVSCTISPTPEVPSTSWPAEAV